MSDDGPQGDQPQSLLALRGVTKRFGGRTVLSGVSLDVAAGEYVAIVGDSGIGKSTLLNVIAGLEPADSGEVIFKEKKLTDYLAQIA